MTEQTLIDQQDRELALDVGDSYIVQAPAGSGKTELLTLRYLKLLAISEQPEEVLAITFTRKAASEMRARILRLLREVNDATAPDQDDELQRQRFSVGSKVLARNQELGWRLLENPSRLRVQTIDSFCHYLASQLPVLSQIGGKAEVSDDVEPCFVDAIDNTLAKLDGQDSVADDIEKLLRHLDNDRNRAQSLLVSLLYKRDQWLSHVLELGSSPDEAREYLRNNLRELIDETLSATTAAIAAYQNSLLPLLNYALENLHKADDAASGDYPALSSWPGSSPADLPEWLQIADVLMTKTNTWRKTINVKSGFPPGKAGDIAHSNKQDMMGLLGQLGTNEELASLFAELRLLPDSQIDSDQWQFLTALLNVLADLAKELQLSFRRFAVIDHPQTSAAALAALGSEEAPTDIALALDHRLQHILVDEFQDTSKVQLALLKQLTAGWQNGDGRTLFLVGDAMQSCYGFRDANVGIYLDVRERGINEIYLTPLTLKANFRSQSKVVDWVNEIFQGAFPDNANASRGAVPYSASQAIHPAQDNFGVRTTLISYGEDDKELARFYEADLIVERIRDLQTSDPGADIAVLVRSRSHFEPIIPRLRSAGISWQATDIDRLASVPVVSDLLSLTRALVNPADRLAWLSVLRAPWCGMDTSGLQTLCGLAEKDSLFSALQHPELQARLDAQNWQRLEAVRAVLLYAMNYRTRLSLYQLIEASWTLLRGEACCESQAELDCVRRFMSLLAEQENANSLDNFARFEKKLANSYVPSATSSPDASSKGTVHLLTMHKAKGLEYDHVILPALTQKSGGMDSKSLLLWHERLNASGVPRLFLGALTATGSDDSRLYNYLKTEKTLKEKLESTRLLYIAVTRAIKSANLFGRLRVDEFADESEISYKNPGSDSLLARIWPQLEKHTENLEWLPSSALHLQAAREEYPQSNTQDALAASFNRFNTAVVLDEDEQAIVSQQPAGLIDGDDSESEDEAREKIQLKQFTGDRLASLVGTLIHEALEFYTKQDGSINADDLPSQLNAYWQTMLARLDLDSEQLEQQIEHIGSTVLGCLRDENTHWLFAGTQQDSQSELSLVSRLSGQLREHKVDRTLIDETGTRWIVDYKTGQPRAGQSEEEFIRQQLSEYGGQLTRYRKLFAEMEQRPVKTALFLTALPRLVEYKEVL